MKNLVIYLGLFLTIISCKNDGIVNGNNLVGKWSHTYFVQTKEQNGTWSEWHQINTLVALPTLEFTVNGKILWDGKPAKSCCQYLSYSIDNEDIKLSELTEASNLCDCVLCDTWKIEKLTIDTLEIEQCFGKARYTRIK
jgi:hypothetical protein